ncbi:MAG: YifB family Mg chelatase-like AAA ATPase [bacterium]|nr:YifB family Mg chelatase-like AAA ATPase [bacterium]
MSLVPKLYSAELEGIEAELVEVEADINVGLHSFNIVGLADKAVSEAKERVNSALKNSQIKPPTKENRRITINLAPADLKKAGSRFDLPIALAYLLASGQLKNFTTENKIFIGELSLDGALRPIAGSLNIAIAAAKAGLKEIFLPAANAPEAAILKNIKVFPLKTLTEAIEHLEEKKLIEPLIGQEIQSIESPTLIKISDIKGQLFAKRALTIAAAGGHNLLMSGPPGTGKTMLAQSLVGLLPPPNFEEMIEMTKIYSANGLNRESPVINYRPFRAPHHSSSLIAIVGGGSMPKPGEISLAHRGILFLDEIPEFHRDVLEALRQPLENGSVAIARAKKSLIFPAKFILVAAMNPCPCGYFNDQEKECRCTANEVFRYQKKISGPFLDRIDLQLEVPRVSLEELRNKESGNEKEVEEIENKIKKARQRQNERLMAFEPRIYTNAEMTSKQTDMIVSLETTAENFLKQMLEKSFLSARSYYRILKIARTIADLADEESVRKEHLAEAFQYRLKNNE